MQDEVNEKTIALYIKTGKLTAQTLQKAMKAILSKGKKQLAKPPQGRQTLKQLMKQNAGVSNIEITAGWFRPTGGYWRCPAGLSVPRLTDCPGVPISGCVPARSFESEPRRNRR